MSALRVYVETSVWNFAFANDVPDYRKVTLEFFDRCRSGAIEPIISAVVPEEIMRSQQPRRDQLLRLIEEIHPTVIEVSDGVEELADAFLQHAIVPQGKREDALHVAAAFVAGLDVLVSWNFKHIASVRRADRFNAVAVLAGYSKPLHIVTPVEVLDDDPQ